MLCQFQKLLYEFNFYYVSVYGIPERSSTPKEKSNIELMLEKIYEQVCKEKEAEKHISDNQFM